jgi:hypothetical protein
MPRIHSFSLVLLASLTACGEDLSTIDCTIAYHTDCNCEDYLTDEFSIGDNEAEFNEYCGFLFDSASNPTDTNSIDTGEITTDKLRITVVSAVLAEFETTGEMGKPDVMVCVGDYLASDESTNEWGCSSVVMDTFTPTLNFTIEGGLPRNKAFYTQFWNYAVNDFGVNVSEYLGDKIISNSDIQALRNADPKSFKASNSMKGGLEEVVLKVNDVD